MIYLMLFCTPSLLLLSWFLRKPFLDGIVTY